MTVKVTSFITPEFVLSFPNLFRPKQSARPKPGQEPKYGVTAVFPASLSSNWPFSNGVLPDITPLKAALLAEAQAKWGVDTSRWPKLNQTLKTVGGPRDADISVSKWFQDDFPGATVVDFTSKQPVGIVDHNVQRILDENAIYAGCICIAEIRVFSYSNETSGVGFGLSNIQKIRDGKRLGGNRPPEAAFKAVAAARGAPAGPVTSEDIPF